MTFFVIVVICDVAQVIWRLSLILFFFLFGLPSKTTLIPVTGIELFGVFNLDGVGFSSLFKFYWRSQYFYNSEKMLFFGSKV